MLTPTSTDSLIRADATSSRAENSYDLQLLTPQEALGDPAIRQEWESLLALGNPLYRAFASPTLYEHASQATPKAENRVAVLRDATGRIVGICPIILWRLTIPFQIRRRILARISLCAATILSGEPLALPEPEVYRRLFEGLLEQLPWCDCVYINSMPVDCFTVRFLLQSEGNKGNYFLHPRRLDERLFLYLEPGESFDAFLKGKNSHARNNLKRRMRRFKEGAPGEMQFLRIERPEQVDSFHEAAMSIALRSWQYRILARPIEETALHRESLVIAAKLGCLRAYLLQCEGQPCAFVIGYQDGDVLQIEQTAYAEDWGKLSPGTVLYYQMVEDLYLHRPPRLVSFGVGINPHKQIFSNRTTYDTALYVLRPTLRNRLRMAAYGLFTGGLKLAKRLFKKGASVAEADDGE